MNADPRMEALVFLIIDTRESRGAEVTREAIARAGGERLSTARRWRADRERMRAHLERNKGVARRVRNGAA